MILAIETSTPVCSIALEVTGGRIWEKRIEGHGVHSERTFTFIEELLDRANATIEDLDAILFSGGPGSYTGLRIGASAVKGLLFGRDVSFYTFPTLFSFAAGVELDETARTIYSVIDARRQHLYVQIFKWNGMKLKPASDPEIAEISEIESQLSNGDTIIGTGWERLDIQLGLKISTVGTEGISANNLIKAWNQSYLKSYFTKTDAKLFEPNYLNMAQINNSNL
ncbi:MAG: tRNA (adenosine(37)-N6)-threonylcarbamoyltransferase complex dimerization subunit type 1 TsaB [Balneolaceae bacterium]